VSGCSLGLGMGGGQSLCVWLVAVVVSCEEGMGSIHHWETVMIIRSSSQDDTDGTSSIVLPCPGS
jgi:hypothetical protein